MWNLPGPGIKAMSPALTGRLLASEPPGKSNISIFMLVHCLDFCRFRIYFEIDNCKPNFFFFFFQNCLKQFFSGSFEFLYEF